MLFKSKIDVDAKLVQTSMLFEDLGAFENFLVFRDEQYDGDCVIITEADISINTETKLMLKGSVYSKGPTSFNKKFVKIASILVYISTGGVCFISPFYSIFLPTG